MSPLTFQLSVLRGIPHPISVCTKKADLLRESDLSNLTYQLGRHYNTKQEGIWSAMQERFFVSFDYKFCFVL